MRTVTFATLLVVSVAATGAKDRSISDVSRSVERPFVQAGRVRLELSAGDYRVSRSVDDRIRVTCFASTQQQVDDTRVDVEVRGREAEVAVDGPDRRDGSHFRVAIELPRLTDLHLRMTAGDLAIVGIEGNKDVRLFAGDLTIEVDEPSKYRRVDASVTAGDIAARPFNFSTGGLFRKFARSGPGRYELRARLWAGDLKLIPTQDAELGARK